MELVELAILVSRRINKHRNKEEEGRGAAEGREEEKGGREIERERGKGEAEGREGYT